MAPRSSIVRACTPCKPQAFAIPVSKVYAVVFALGAALAALAAVLIVPIKQAHYLMGQDPLLLKKLRIGDIDRDGDQTTNEMYQVE